MLERGIQFEDLRSAASTRKNQHPVYEGERKHMINRISLARVPSVRCPSSFVKPRISFDYIVLSLSQIMEQKGKITTRVTFDDIAEWKHDAAEGILKVSWLSRGNKFFFFRVRVTSNNSLSGVRKSIFY